MYKKIIIFLLSFFAVMTTVSAKEYYVDSANGTDNFNYSGSESRPFATIQKAVDTAKAGDIVNVLPGVYYGPINVTNKGTANAHITIRAVESGENKTVITNANKKVRENKNGNVWTLDDEESNIWVTDYTVQKNAPIDVDEPEYLFPARMLSDDVDLLAFDSYLNLKNGKYPDNKLALDYGYYYDIQNHKLYVRLRTDGKYGSSNPNEHTMKVAPAFYTYRSSSSGWGGSGSGRHGNIMGTDSYNLCVGVYDGVGATERTRADSYYVDIDGFTFETPGFSGIFLRASDVTIKNCWFRGCRSGVRGAPRVRYDELLYSDNILIENCDYSQYPLTDDAIEMINRVYAMSDAEKSAYSIGDFYWWLRKGTNDFSENFNYESGGFTTFMGTNWAIKKNYIHDCFDGISTQAMQQYAIKNGQEVGAENIEISGNVFENILDNAIELENHGKNIKIYDNEFKNIFIPISWQPLDKTPWPTNIRIGKNVFHNTRDFNEMWRDMAGHDSAIFKIGCDVSQFAEGEVPEKFSATEEGVWIFNNTIVSPGAELFSNVSGSGKSYILFDNFRFVNNAVVCNVEYSKLLENGTYSGRVLYRDDIGFEFSNNVFALDNLKRISVFTDNMLTEGQNVYNANNIGFKAISRLKLNPELKEESVLIGAGISDRFEPLMSKDIGAVNSGEQFHNYHIGVNVR